MQRFANFVVRRRRAVIVFWIGLLLVTATIGSSAFSVLSTDFGAGTTTESGQFKRLGMTTPTPFPVRVGA